MADGDLISRASLLAGIAELKESPWHNFGKADGTSPEGVEAIWHYGYLQRKEAVEIIEDICIKKEPAVLAESGWISVKDEMPKLGQRVMAFCRAGIMTFLRYDGEVWFEMSSKNKYLHRFVTHWQHLPELPKEDNYVDD